MDELDRDTARDASPSSKRVAASIRELLSNPLDPIPLGPLAGALNFAVAGDIRTDDRNQPIEVECIEAEHTWT